MTSGGRRNVENAMTRACFFVGVALLGAIRAGAQDQVFLTEKEALDTIFGDGVKVGRGTIALTPAQLKEIQKGIGGPVGASHEVFVGERGGQLAGFAMIWEEIGKYKPITFMVGVEPSGKILDILIMVYREPIGSDVTKPWWRKMFKGKGAADPLRIGKDILKINGATMSCDAICLGARKVTAILEATLLKNKAAALRIAKEEDKASAAVRRLEVVMGSTCSIAAFGPADAVDKAMAEIRRVGEMLSASVGGGALSRFNEGAGKGDRRIDPELGAFLETCLSFAAKTEGAFDPTVGPALKLWGFYDHRYNVPSRADIAKALALIGHARLKVDRDRQVASLRDRGMMVDAAGIARGYAVDRAVGILRDQGVSAALIDFGGRRYALGAPPGAETWKLPVRSPFDASVSAFTLAVKDSAVCTLDRFEEFFEEGGKAYIRIIDPATGRPVEGMAGVTVVSKSCAEADALSTALFVRGFERGRELARSFGVEAAWIPADEKLRIETTPGFGAHLGKDK
jgi:thiamine biosynthesis lipoprotein